MNKTNDQLYVEWSSPKKLLKIINNLKNDQKITLRKKFVKNKLQEENLLEKYKNIFLGFDYQINFKCISNGSYFNQLLNFQMSCVKNNKLVILIL